MRTWVATQSESPRGQDDGDGKKGLGEENGDDGPAVALLCRRGATSIGGWSLAHTSVRVAVAIVLARCMNGAGPGAHTGESRQGASLWGARSTKLLSTVQFTQMLPNVKL